MNFQIFIVMQLYITIHITSIFNTANRKGVVGNKGAVRKGVVGNMGFSVAVVLGRRGAREGGAL